MTIRRRHIGVGLALAARLLAFPALAASPWSASGQVDLDSMTDLSRNTAPRSGSSALLQWGGTLDAAQAWGWSGAQIDFGAQAVHVTGDASDGSAALQSPNNEWAPDFARITALDIAQRLPDVTWRIGILDLNQYFESSGQASLLHNGSFGMAPNFTANVATPTYPIPGAAAMLTTVPAAHWQVRAGVWQGAPPIHGGGFSRGSLWIGEVERDAIGGSSDLKLGLWHARGTLPDLSGAYLVGETRWRSGTHDCGAFVLAGSTPGAATEVGNFIATGVRLGAPLAARPRDQISVGFSRADIASARAEDVTEVVYQWRLRHGIDLQPDVQYIAHSGGGPTAAWLAGMRLDLDF